MGSEAKIVETGAGSPRRSAIGQDGECEAVSQREPRADRDRKIGSRRPIRSTRRLAPHRGPQGTGKGPQINVQPMSEVRCPRRRGSLDLGLRQDHRDRYDTDPDEVEIELERRPPRRLLLSPHIRRRRQNLFAAARSDGPALLRSLRRRSSSAASRTPADNCSRASLNDRSPHLMRRTMNCHGSAPAAVFRLERH